MMKTIKSIRNRIKQVNKTVTMAVGLNHGLKNTLVQTLKVIKEEGFGGVWQRIMQIADAHNGLKNTKDGFYRNDYTEWIKRYDTLTPEDIAAMKTRQAGFVVRPLISIIMPVYNPKLPWLIQAIESVCRQVYPQQLYADLQTKLEKVNLWSIFHRAD